jgi:hypothetical protein
MSDGEIGEGAMESADLENGRVKELEEEIGRVLRDLPHPKAPPTLLARVMEGVREADAVPWYRARAGWFHWPVEWRAASLVLMGVLIVGGVLGGPLLLENAGLSDGAMEAWLMNLFAPAFALAALLRVGIVAVEAAVGALPSQAVGLVGVGALLMVAVTIAFGAALRRLSPDWEMFT